jgi:hypothetical protein
MLRNLALPATAVLALTLSACTGGDAPETDPSALDRTPSSSSPVVTASDTSPTPEPPLPEPEPLRAADGERYQACADGACEVVVTVGTTFALDPGVAGGMETFEITEIDDDGAGADFDGPGQNIHAFATAGAGSFVANGLPYTVVEVQGDQAVIRLGE